jgi:hypothetical protein
MKLFLDKDVMEYMKLKKDYEIYCFQWCSQEFLSIGQFLSQTIFRIG